MDRQGRKGFDMKTNWRDGLAFWIMSFAMRHIATKAYYDFLRAVNKLGLEEFDRLYREHNA